MSLITQIISGFMISLSQPYEMNVCVCTVLLTFDSVQPCCFIGVYFCNSDNILNYFFPLQFNFSSA